MVNYEDLLDIGILFNFESSPLYRVDIIIITINSGAGTGSVIYTRSHS